ncbi:MAG TPA: DUF2235 domain-containing protein [Thermohalobaculum sp.]|nr:DUF2235 domain-containing protein [Thermohalobaculum sp.]
MKRLVVCFDGTWNSADSGGSETSVSRIARAVRATSQQEGTQQATLYLRGVGSTGIALQRALGGITGEGVDDNIRSAYMFLAQNYVPEVRDDAGEVIYAGDRIFVFGFSRGAFTARSLCGFIGCAGLLKRQCLGQLADAWRYYRRGGPRTSRDFCTEFDSDCHHDLRIDFLGVWDTVGALGVPVGLLGDLTAPDYKFHDTEPSSVVRRACHALAIDEYRDEFVPTLWTGEVPEGCTVRQVWFAGAHSDVGGGYAESRLADIPLVWMAKQAEEATLVLDWSVLPDPQKLDPLAPQHDSRQGWSWKDRLTPTYRRVCERDCDVGLLSRLYVPRGEDGEVLKTVNESVHPEVFVRHGSEVDTIRRTAENSKDPEKERAVYDPVNLPPDAPRFAPGDGGKAGRP